MLITKWDVYIKLPIPYKSSGNILEENWEECCERLSCAHEVETPVTNSQQVEVPGTRNVKIQDIQNSPIDGGDLWTPYLLRSYYQLIVVGEKRII